ncbi:MAG: adenylate/guanylate cyclase domain-containing protein [Thermoanaerobaculia bacterium]
MAAQRGAPALILGLLASLLAGGAEAWRLFSGLEPLLVDRMMAARGSQAGDSRIALVEIDEAAIDAYGRWPWSRSRVAELIAALNRAGARVIALDMVFSEPSRADAVVDLRFEDEALARAIAESGNVVLGYFFRSTTEPGECRGGADLEPFALSQVIEPPGGFPGLEESRRHAVEPSLEAISRATAAQGFLNTGRAASGRRRTYPLVAACGGFYYPALALAAVAQFEGQPLALSATSARRPRLELGGREVEADDRGNLWINYRGPKAPEAWQRVAIADLLEGRVAPRALAGKLVFVGAAEAGIGDLQTTPFGTEIPGVEVHAHVADNLLTGRFIHDTETQGLVSLLALLALGPVVSLVVARLRPYLLGSLLAVGLVALWLPACYGAFRAAGWHLQVAAPLAAGLGSLVATLCYQIGFVDRRARQLRRNFEHYLAPQIVRELEEHPERARLGGERRELTVLFSDIRGFTDLAEGLEPERVARLLNQFFTPMTRLVLAEGGTLDKYMGDALMAFFGAPVAQADHALRACRAALAMRAELARINAAWAAAGELPEGRRIGIGIGLASGEMAVGNMGSEEVFDYTVLGDNVNLGSRIEGLNKPYGTVVLLAEATAVAVSGAFLCREVDRVRVKGKAKPVAIFELLAPQPGSPGEQQLVARFAEALASYRARRFEAAEEQLLSLLEAFPGDGPARHLLERCRHYRETPPPDAWDGVEVLTSK